MAVETGEWNTANNKAVEAELHASQSKGEEGAGEGDELFLSLLKSAATHAKTHAEQDLHSRWQDSYRAWRNEHFSNSKYTSDRWRGRSKIFRPKTRTTVRKRMADAAASLFATNDALSVEPANKGDPKNRAGAALMREILNYRLQRRSAESAIPWFVTAMAAYQDTQIAGLCVSKQYWEYEQRQVGIEQQPMVDETGMQMMDIEGNPVFKEVPILKVVRNRPVIRLYPPELALRDPAANWIDQAQDSGYIILKNPMQVGDALKMLDGTVQSGGGATFRHIEEGVLLSSSAGRAETSSKQVRDARADNVQDPYEGRGPADDFSIVWLWENFIRVEGETWHFWSVEDRLIVSDPAPVDEVYPEHEGRRPVVIGFGAIDAHRTDPMAPVEAWMPLQQEMNDVANLRLDAMKQSVSPVTKVVRGKKISAKEVQNRGPDSIIYVQDKDDVSWDAIPGPNSSAYAEMERLNADFDDQAGIFSQGSVMTNRSLNETVGGMNLMNQSANILGQFDIQVWVETWGEPVLRQLLALEAFYETDDMVLMIAGDQAQIEQKFGVPLDFDLLEQPCTVHLNAGLGVSDPMQRLQKLGMAGQIVAQFIPTIGQRMRQDEIISEAFGLAGYQDGMRFFHEGDDQDPRIVELQQAVQQLQAALEDKEAERQAKLEAEQLKGQTKLQSDQIHTAADLEEQRMRNEAARELKRMDLEGSVGLKRMDVAGKLIADQVKPKPPPPRTNGSGPPRGGSR